MTAGIGFTPAVGLRPPRPAITPAASTIGGAARIPSTYRPTFVMTAISISCTDAQDRTVNVQVETGIGTGVYDTIAVHHWNPDVSGIGVGITALLTTTSTVFVPPGCGYRYTQSGTGTTAIVQQREQTI